MAQSQHTPYLAPLEEALTVLFCLVDDAYYLLNPNGRRYETLKEELSDSEEVVTLALFQQSSEGCRASAPSSCATQRGSSRTCCSRGLWGFTLLPR